MYDIFENECYEGKSKDGYTLHYLDVLNETAHAGRL